MATYKNGTVKGVTTPLDGTPAVATIEADNPNHDPNADPPDPNEPPRKDFTFEFDHDPTITRLINCIDPPTTVIITTDGSGTPTYVTYKQ